VIDNSEGPDAKTPRVETAFIVTQFQQANETIRAQLSYKPKSRPC